MNSENVGIYLLWAIVVFFIFVLGVMAVEELDPDRRKFMVQCLESGKRSQDCDLLWGYKKP